MWNVLTLASAVGSGFGLAVIAAAVRSAARSLGRWAETRSGRAFADADGVYTGIGAPDAVYVPGSFRRAFVVGSAGALVLAVSLPVGLIGIGLDEFVRGTAAEPRLAAVSLTAETLDLETADGSRQRHVRPGPQLVAHAEYIRFARPLERLRLGPYWRLVALVGHQQTAPVAPGAQGIGRVEVAPATRPAAVALEWVARRLPQLVQVNRRYSPGLDAGTREADLWCTGAGTSLEWRAK